VTVGDSLTITNNVLLAEFCGLYNLLSNPNNGITNITITGNLANPTSQEIINQGICVSITTTSNTPSDVAELPGIPWYAQLALMLVVIGAVGGFLQFRADVFQP